MQLDEAMLIRHLPVQVGQTVNHEQMLWKVIRVELNRDTQKLRVFYIIQKGNQIKKATAQELEIYEIKSEGA